MKVIIPFKLIFVLAIFSCSNSYTPTQNEAEPELSTGEYLGQPLPGSTPIKFAPGFISRDGYFEHSAAVFSPNGKEVFWAAKADGERYFLIYFMKMAGDIWTAPEPAPFNRNTNNNRPVFSPDGSMLYFDSDGEIWMSEKSGEVWGDPERIGSVIDGNEYEIIHSITADGSIYFSRSVPGTDNRNTMNEIHVARNVDGEFDLPVRLGNTINSDDAQEMALYVSPDESYMIIEETRDNRLCELFISYRLNDNSWSDRINTNLGWGRFPHASPDGNYLFYMTHDGIYWVNTSFVGDLRPDGLK